MLLAVGGCSAPNGGQPGGGPNEAQGPDTYIVHGRRYHVRASAAGYVERGIASWYGGEFHGRRTSNGERYDMHAMTAAHRSLPLSTRVEVTNLDNGRSVVVRINDRGPFHDNRIIDLSLAAARKLGIARQGTGLVEVRALAGGRARGASAPTGSEDGPGDPEIYIQLGAFAERDNALRIHARAVLHDLTPVAIERASPKGRRLYRVRIGPIPSVEAADRTVAQLKQAGIGDYQVVVE